jgi:C4-dicarboxylate-specific signal transduction histidine kinase
LKVIRDHHGSEVQSRRRAFIETHLDQLNMLGEMATGIAHEINQY